MNTPHDRAPKQRAAHGLSGLATGSPDGLATVFPPCTCRAGEDRPDLRLTSSLAMTDCHRIRPRSGGVCRASHELSPVATGTPSNQAGSPSRRTLRRRDSGPPGAVGVTARPKDWRPANMPGMTSSGSGGWQSTTRHRGASAPGLGPPVDRHDRQGADRPAAVMDAVLRGALRRGTPQQRRWHCGPGCGGRTGASSWDLSARRSPAHPAAALRRPGRR